MNKARPLSIRRQLLTWLLIPLTVLWLVSTAVDYYRLVFVAEDRYDAELINSADSVIARIDLKNGKVMVDMPPHALALLKHGDHQFYYQVLSRDLDYVEGNAVLPNPEGDLTLHLPKLNYGVVRGERVRLCTIRTPIEDHGDYIVIVQVAEPVQPREEFTHHLLAITIVPQLLLIGLSCAAIWIGIGRGLSQLKELEQALTGRSQFDLSPISDATTPEEVRPLVRSINDLLGRLREDIDAQRRFVANAAHQMRTPLAGLKTYVGVVSSMAEKAELKELSTAVGQLDNGLNRITHLVNRLLALARAGPAAATIVKRQDFDLNQIAAEATSDLVGDAIGKNIDLAFEGAGGPLMVRGDPASVRELVMNLVDNAVRYTPGGGHVTVRVQNGRAALLVVEDDGPGIPEAERERVFERFYRVLGAGGDGSGLGLAIVQEIAKSHAAKVRLESSDNGGTTVKVEFNMTVAAADVINADIN